MPSGTHCNPNRVSLQLPLEGPLRLCTAGSYLQALRQQVVWAMAKVSLLLLPVPSIQQGHALCLLSGVLWARPWGYILVLDSVYKDRRPRAAKLKT